MNVCIVSVCVCTYKIDGQRQRQPDKQRQKDRQTETDTETGEGRVQVVSVRSGLATAVSQACSEASSGVTDSTRLNLGIQTPVLLLPCLKHVSTEPSPHSIAQGIPNNSPVVVGGCENLRNGGQE